MSLTGSVSVSKLAEELGVKRPSVSRAISGLAKAGLIKHEIYGDIEVTDEGKSTGSQILRRSQCLNKLMIDILKMDPEEAGVNEQKLGHLISDDLLVRLETMVDFSLGSEAWIKRLQFRIDKAQETELEK